LEKGAVKEEEERTRESDKNRSKERKKKIEQSKRLDLTGLIKNALI
jgi:hypothetical protein